MSPTKRSNADPDDLTSEFHRKLTAMQRNPDDLSPDGPTAQFLAFIGLRSDDDDWDVGETP